MGKLRPRKGIRVIGNIVYLPINLLVSLFLWVVLDISFKEAWTADLENEP